jgi:hypothetical protein
MNMLAPSGVITPERVYELIPRECFCKYVVRTAGEFVSNEGGVVQLPAPYIMLSAQMCHSAGGMGGSPNFCCC